jgi:phage replication O-like protein O
LKINSPQLEKGHTRIANELLEAIINYPFTAAQIKVVFVVIRKTYGWHRKKSEISYGAIAYLTGFNKRYIKKVVDRLITDKVLIKEKNNLKNILGLNKRYLQWRMWISLKGGVLQDTPKVSCRTPGGVLEDTIKGVLQDTTQKKKRNINKDSSKERDKLSTISFLKDSVQAVREGLNAPMPIAGLIV